MTSARPQTFLFADLAGYMALTEAHGDEEAAETSARFCRGVRELLHEHGGSEVNTLGDTFVVRVAEAAAAVRLGLRIVHDVAEQHGFPAVRVGMNTGPAIERHGDWFGATVNLAARVPAAAASGEVLLTGATREEMRDPDDIELEARGPQRFTSFSDPVALFAAFRRGERRASPLDLDPVCRMAVDRSRAAGILLYKGTEYRFCCLPCAEAFAARPQVYAARG